MGYLSPGSPPASQAFWQGMRDLGYVEDKNIFVEYRWAEGEPARLPDLAAELIRLNVDVIFALGPAAFAVKSAATTTPVIFASRPRRRGDRMNGRTSAFDPKRTSPCANLTTSNLRVYPATIHFPA